MIYEAFEDRETRGDWRVEVVEEEGEIEIPHYVTLFSGHTARERAIEYAAWQNERQRSRVAA
jgi:hypothetical protein